MGADFSGASCPQECTAAMTEHDLPGLFDQARHVRLPKQTDPEKLRRATLSVLAIRRRFFEDAMRRKDERLMTMHAERMDRLERMIADGENAV